MKQAVIFGEGCFERLSSFLNERQFRKVVLVTGQHFESKKLENHFSDFGDQFFILQVSPQLLSNELIKNQIDGLSFLPDVIIAIGGGRIIDSAKLILHNLKNSPVFFIAIPTTAGSGSEATQFAVLYEGMKKLSIAEKKLLPDAVFLDPVLLETLSAKQKAISAIDALAQAIESLWNVNATDESKIYAAEALKILWTELPQFVLQQNQKRNKKVQWAAYLAGKAINITRTTGCHALSYYLTAKHGVPHGQAVCLFLPAFFIYNSGTDLKIIFDILEVENVENAFEKVSGLIVACGLANRFAHLAIDVDIDELIASVNEERFANNPEPFDKEKLKNLITKYIA